MKTPAFDADSEDAEGPERTDEVRAIRALAHPLRLRMLDLLRFDGPATATLLAARLGESSGATSYHLRMLARYGFVEEELRAGHHERWWRYRERQVIVPSDPRDDLGERNLLAGLLSREAHALDRYLVERGRHPQGDEAAFLRTAALRLTIAEFEQLRDAFVALIEPLRRADAEEAPKDAIALRVFVLGFPQILEES